MAEEFLNGSGLADPALSGSWLDLDPQSPGTKPMRLTNDYNAGCNSLLMLNAAAVTRCCPLPFHISC